MTESKHRCSWATDDLLVEYHDNEYGRWNGSDNGIFEKVCLESFSAGLSWRLVLVKREAFRKRFAGFDIDRCASLTDGELAAAMDSPDIIRNARKIEAVRSNARVCQQIVAEYGSMRSFIQAHPAAEELHSAFKKRGARQFGPVCASELLKSLGMLPAHESGCYLAGAVHREVR